MRQPFVSDSPTREPSLVKLAVEAEVGGCGFGQIKDSSENTTKCSLVWRFTIILVQAELHEGGATPSRLAALLLEPVFERGLPKWMLICHFLDISKIP